MQKLGAKRGPYNKIVVIIGVLLLVMVAGATAGRAQDGGQGQGGGKAGFFEACKDDIATLCKDVQPGGGRILQCLNQHAGSLSAGCKSAVPSSSQGTTPSGGNANAAAVSGTGHDSGQAGAKAGGFFEACRDDIASLCKDIQPGGGRMVQCLNQHAGSLSAGCKSALPTFSQTSQPVAK